MKVRILPIAALVVATAIAAASAMQGVNIKWTPKEGAIYKYKMNAKMNVGQDVTVSATITNKIDKVLTDKVTIIATQSDSKVDVGGQAMDQPESTETQTVAFNGEVLESKSSTEMPGMNMRRMAQSFQFIYPGNEVKEGETWVHKSKANKEKGLFDSETTFKYIGIEEVEGIKCWKVTSEFKESGAPTNATATSTFWISSVDSELVKTVNTGKSITISDDIPSFDMEATTIRVK